MDSVELREKEFHDRVFAEKTRAKVAPFYALATASRKELESDKKATRAFKDKVDDARKALKEG